MSAGVRPIPRPAPRRPWWPSILILVALLAPRSSRAQSTLTRTSVAQALFAEGRAALANGDVAQACVKFQESYTFEASAGTLLNLAICHEKQGRLASALAELGESVNRAVRDQRKDRETIAREHMAAVAPRVSRITVRVDLAADVPGFAVTLDGTPLTRPVWGVGVPVDPGSHPVEATAPGRQTWHSAVSITLEESKTLDISPLLPVEVAVTDGPAVLPPPSPSPPPEAVIPRPVAKRPLRTAGWALLGVGAAGLATGSVLGALAIVTWDGASKCPNGLCPTAADKASYQGAGTLADASTVAFVAGGLLAAAGTFLVVWSPRVTGGTTSWQAGPAIQAGGVEMGITGRF